MLFSRTTHRVEVLDTSIDPFYAEGADAPVPTPEEAAAWVVDMQDAFLLFAMFCAGMAVHHFLF
jgi:hypothetical protein